MKTKTILILGLAVIIGFFAATRFARKPVARLSFEPTLAPKRTLPSVTTSAANSDPVPGEPARSVSETVFATTNNSPKLTVPPTSPTPSPKEKLADPLARAALRLVGVDPAAEQYWLAAIYDPNLSDQEREDLMEDLNEDGLSDPRHPGPEDFPLILNRLAILEEIAPYADEFMLPHLAEAYRDLANLLAGQPPQ